MKSALSTLLELLGLVALVVGAGLVYAPAGWIVAGLGLVAVGYSIGD